MRMSYLKEFVGLASYTKLTTAARALHMSPSTLSQHLAALEKEVGCELFSREGGFTLTREGETALDHAQKILFEYGEMLRDCASSTEKALRLSFPEFDVCQPPLAAAEPLFAERHPGMKIILSPNSYDAADPVEVLTEGLSDASAIFLVRGGGLTIEEAVPPEVSWIPVGPYRCVFACTPDHPNAAKSALTRADLHRATVISGLNPVASIVAEGVAQVLEKYGAPVRVLYKRILRNDEAFLDGVRDEYVQWIVPIDGAPGDFRLPGYPFMPFEEDIVADGYILYHPGSLSPLQLEYLELARTLQESTHKA
ncbi:LysR family transcriptional regulator [uncultured Adlercreutzia sp.]|uniref:LysR family transcriptional regulator n=1 Tax=uncultured Adlercreutzia sp. TaxID=875803 RepID=UPI002674B5C2|nr:LysR family transcriptional regulator [uncultured Adlercreutzia sp.]